MEHSVLKPEKPQANLDDLVTLPQNDSLSQLRLLHWLFHIQKHSM